MLLASPVVSAELSCEGTNPEWHLDLNGETARFVFPAATDMDVMLETVAEGRDWPIAFTLIGARDTAILLVEQQHCGPQSAPYRARIMTQRVQTPILLVGCCDAAG